MATRVDQAPQLDQISEAVALALGVAVNEMKSGSQQAAVSTARHVAMYLCRRYTDASFPAIGDYFCRSHAAVIYAVENIGKIRRRPGVNQACEALTVRLDRIYAKPRHRPRQVRRKLATPEVVDLLTQAAIELRRDPSLALEQCVRGAVEGLAAAWRDAHRRREEAA